MPRKNVHVIVVLLRLKIPHSFVLKKSMKEFLSYTSMLRGLTDNILRATSTKGASYFIDDKGSKLEK